jgi:hypothetical protein
LKNELKPIENRPEGILETISSKIEIISGIYKIAYGFWR